MRAEHRPLVVTAQPDLLDEVLGIAAAVGVAVDVAVDPAGSSPQWTTAPTVVVGDDVALLLANSMLRRRPGVIVVGRAVPDDTVRAAAAAAGVEGLLALPAGESELAERLADAVEPAPSARVMGVIGGCGGAGASVLAATLALIAARRPGAAWLLDVDPLGGGVDVLLGAELDPGTRWPDIRSTTGRVSVKSLRDAIPRVAGVTVLSCDGRSTDDPSPAALRTVVSAAARGGGTVVVDLPRHPTDARSEALTALDEVLVVVPATVRAVLAARQALAGMGPVAAPARLLVRSSAGGVPEDEVARALGAPLAGVVDEEPAVRAASLAGSPDDLASGTALASLCERLLDEPATLRSAA